MIFICCFLYNFGYIDINIYLRIENKIILLILDILLYFYLFFVFFSDVFFEIILLKSIRLYENIFVKLRMYVNLVIVFLSLCLRRFLC